MVIFHGLLAFPQFMIPIGRRLRKHGRVPVYTKYLSMNRDIPECARCVSMQLKAAGIKEFDAVTHSMGGVVLRWAMNHFEMPRLRRAVMICPPNTGAWIAQHLSQKLGPMMTAIYNQAGLQLRPNELGLTERAGDLRPAEVGIIAGGSGTTKGLRNFFGIPGDNDGIVAVQEMILPGMKDFVLLNSNHTGVLINSQVTHMANLFLDHGIFRPRIPQMDEEEQKQ